MELFDSHAHYEDAMFDTDRYDRLRHLKNTDVKYIMNCCSDESVFDTVTDICNKYDFAYGSIGVHPHWVLSCSGSYLEKIRELAKNEKIVAIGEMGLDYFWDEPKDLQKKVFIRQLELSKELNMPVIIHDRDAHEDCFEILRKYKPQGVVHRYGGPTEYIKEAFEWGMYVSFNNDLTYPAWNKAHIDVLNATPWDRLLIETDCPYCPPFERSEDRCEAYDVANVVKEIAKLRGVSEEFVAKVSMENAKKAYGIRD